MKTQAPLKEIIPQKPITQFEIVNENNFKGTRVLLLILQVAIVIGELVAIFIIMQEVRD